MAEADDRKRAFSDISEAVAVLHHSSSADLITEIAAMVVPFAPRLANEFVHGKG
ncbi:hypothetical protein [Streptomyces xantholiticus]|uniref:hypothetical protein n=1 Tax=Streptomyces xantholiticus TaxID=68285 RepID=UPI00167AAC2A|nr:hypothetical protein [Streptomyces xantholiticus]GGW65141.1 hypothetical protein GCM10010381_57620 [Streptomyces xantholiticus]